MKFEGYIELFKGIWYCEITTSPFSNREQKIISNTEGHETIYTNKLHKIKQNKDGYFTIKTDNNICMWHRLVYEYFKGPIPEGMQVDHKDNNRLNNHPDNLKLSNHIDNCRKRLKQKNNTSGYPGVHIAKGRRKKFTVVIRIQNKNYHLGAFYDPLDAFICYLENKIYYHGWDSILPIV
jgi:hypothetical protein